MLVRLNSGEKALNKQIIMVGTINLDNIFSMSINSSQYNAGIEWRLYGICERWELSKYIVLGPLRL